MCSIEKVIRGKIKSEQDYFNALYDSLHTDGIMMSMSSLLERSFRLFPNNSALIWQDKEISYRELYYRACVMSKKLLRLGVKPRDRILLFFENSLEFYIGYYGILQAGAVVAPLNIFLKEAELQHIVSDAKPTLIIASTESHELFSKVEGISSIPILTEKDMELETLVPTTIPHVEIPRLGPDEMVALLYTSGTTGLPKGVMLSSRNIMINMIQGLSRLQLLPGERLFGILPLFHSFAQNTCVWLSLFTGCTVILVPKIERRYILQGLQHKPTIFLGVPALYGLLCLLKTAPLDSVRYFVSGGDALPDRIRMAFGLLYRRKICSGYGLTETSPFVSIDFADETVPTNNVGRPLLGIDCSVRDEQGNEIVAGEIGELWLRGANIMLGYYNAPEMTQEAMVNNWFRTGDLAYIDTKGRIVITGRIKDLIIHKGLNIYPQEIENVIQSHPNVIRVGVIGEEADTGEVPIAYVQVRKEDAGLEKALMALCVRQLASYKVPRKFILTTDNLPTTATGKVDKKVLRKQHAEQDGQ